MSGQIEELARRMAAGDQEAFDRLMEIFYTRALRMAYLISGNYADSQDIVQETFVILYVNRKKIKEPRYFERWLIRTLTREAWRVCRRRSREQPAEEVFQRGEPAGPSVLEEVMEGLEDRELYQAVLDLPPKQRTAVVLYYFDGMSTKEIGAVMGCLEGTVKSRLFTARACLRRALTRERETCKKEAAL